MANTKKYYWLKLKKDFFKDRKMKKLRRIAGGAIYTVIYLKLQLLSLENDGYIEFEGIEENLAGELELELDETKEDIEATLFLLEKWGLVECKEKDLYLPQVVESTGKESSSAERVRKMRLKNKEEKEKALLCNTPVTICNTEKSKSKSIELDKEKDNNTAVAVSPVKQILKRYREFVIKALPDINIPVLDSQIMKLKKHIDENLFIELEKSSYLQGKEKSKPGIHLFTIIKNINDIKLGAYRDKEIKDLPVKSDFKDNITDEKMKEWGLI